jgi:DNA-binding NarL/FixJ family response regulator
MQKINVIIVDDHRLYAKCISSILGKYKDIHIHGEVSSILEYLNGVWDEQPNVALLGVKMNKTEVVNTIQLSRKMFPSIKLIAFVFNEEEKYYHDLVKAGIHGILLKDSSMAELLKGIRSVVQNTFYITPKINGGKSTGFNTDKENI